MIFMKIPDTEKSGSKINFLHSISTSRTKDLAISKLRSLGLSYGEPAIAKYYVDYSKGEDIAMVLGIGVGDGDVAVVDAFISDGSEDGNDQGIYKLTEGTAISIDNLSNGKRKISVNVSPSRDNLLRTDDYGDLIVDRTDISGGGTTDTYTKKEIDQKFSGVNSEISELLGRINIIDGDKVTEGSFRFEDSKLSVIIIEEVSSTIDSKIEEALSNSNIDGGAW